MQLLQSCPTLGDPMDCSLPASPVHRVLQARILEWIAFPFSGDLPHPGIKSASPVAPALQADFSPMSQWGNPKTSLTFSQRSKDISSINALKLSFLWSKWYDTETVMWTEKRTYIFRSPFHLLDILSVSPRVSLLVPVSLKVGSLWLQNLLYLTASLLIFLPSTPFTTS